MNTQIIGYRISYIVFAIFVSCLIVFTIHKGFQRQDIITIPIFAILLFLIIDFSAKSMYQNKMEKFITEGFGSQLKEQFTQEEESNQDSFGKNKTYKFRSGRAGYMAEGTLVNSSLEKDKSQKDEINKVQCPPKDGKKGFWVCNEMNYNNGKKVSTCGCMYGIEYNDKRNIFNTIPEEESNKDSFGKNKTYKFRSGRAGYMAEGTLVNSSLEKDKSQKDEINKVQCPPKDGKKGFWVCNEMNYNNGKKVSTCGCMYGIEYNDKRNIFNTIPEEESRMIDMKQKNNVTEEKKSRMIDMDQKNNVMEEETYQKYASVENKPKSTEKQGESKTSATPSGDKKAKEATNKQDERPDINKHLMDDGNNGLTNRNSDTNNPININVSYNNNRPYTVNDFNNEDIDKNVSERFKNKDMKNNDMKNNDINKYRFDDGCMNRSVKSGIDNINQKYNPAYLKNPLNKNQPKVNDNYEVKMMKNILSQQNDPSPVLLENPWSEWKPLDK